MLSPAQLAMRRLGIGSSDIAAIAGVDKYRTAQHVFNEKVYPIAEVAGPATGRDPRRWGHRLQRLVVQEWVDVNQVEFFQDEPGTFKHADPKFSLALASPDAWAMSVVGVETQPKERRAAAKKNGKSFVVAPVRLCEAKAPGWRMADAWSDDESPESYLVQTQWQMGVLGVQATDLCALIGGQDFRMRAVDFDMETFGLLYDIAAKFWTDHILKGVSPPLDHSEAAAEYLRRRFPKPKAGMLVLADDEPTMVRAWEIEGRIRARKAEKETADEAEKSARNQLKELVGDNEGIEGVCTYKPVHKDAYEVAAQDYRELRLATKKKERKK